MTVVFPATFGGACPMPRFYFHVREGAEISRDREGQELPDAEAARREAVNTSREILGERLLHGGALNHCRIEIADETGLVVDTVPFAETVLKNGHLRGYDDDITQSASVNPRSR
jgi:hypothetical protein